MPPTYVGGGGCSLGLAAQSAERLQTFLNAINGLGIGSDGVVLGDFPEEDLKVIII